MYDSKTINLFETIVPAQSTRLISVPVNISQGDVIINQQSINGCTITGCLSTTTNSKCIVEISNPTSNDIIFSLDRPVTANIFNEQTLFANSKDNARFQEISSRLRTDHLNAEERANLLSLCTEFSDIFYLENEPLTFTNKILYTKMNR